MNFLTLISILINLVFALIFLGLLFLLLRPQIMVSWYNSYIPSTCRYYDYESDKDIDVEKLGDYKLYTIRPHRNQFPNRVILFITGGFFVRAYPEFSMLHQLKGYVKVYTCTYPVLFKHELSETFDYFDKVIQHIIRINPPETKITLMAHSAGCFYAVHMIQSMRYAKHIDQFAGYCGYYGYTFADTLSLALLDRLYLSGVLSPKYTLDAPNLRHKCRLLLATAEDDFLKNHTLNFARHQKVKPYVYHGDHNFLCNESPAQWISDLMRFMRES